jgi:uncharacterized damage-inducible protein DinB
MISSGKWFDRKFAFQLGVEHYPLLVERLRGTPARIEDRIAGVPAETLTRKDDDGWSIQESIGHLMLLESMWYGRVEDLMNGLDELRPVDLTNRRTEDAGFNKQSIDEIARSFRTERMKLVALLESLNEEQVLTSALHPRLQQPMRTLDLVYFIAEHDDHHMATITGMLTA